MRSHAHALSHTPVPTPDTGFEHTALHLKATTAAHTASSGSGGSILRTVIGLVIVIAVIYGLTWIVRKLKAKDAPAAGDGLERIATLALGTNRSVALVRVGHELHLLGIAEQAVTGIRTFSEDEAIELGLPVTPPGSVISGRRRGGRDDAPDTASTGADPGSGLSGLSGTLETLRRRTQR